MLLDGNVVLCVRSDDPNGRHYDGRVGRGLGQARFGLPGASLASRKESLSRQLRPGQGGLRAAVLSLR